MTIREEIKEEWRQFRATPRWKFEAMFVSAVLGVGSGVCGLDGDSVMWVGLAYSGWMIWKHRRAL